MIKINLLSEGRKPVVARKAKPTISFGGQEPNNILLIAGMVVGALAAGGWWYYLHAQVAALDRDIRQANAEYEQLKPIIQEVQDFQRKKENLEAKVAVIKDLKRKQRGPVFIMDKVSRALPDLVWLENLQVAGNQVTLRGKAFNTNAVAAFYQNIDEIDEFTEPDAKNIAAGGELFSFQISFGFIPPKEPEEEGAEGETEEL